jgi:hypothetical protein
MKGEPFGDACRRQQHHQPAEQPGGRGGAGPARGRGPANSVMGMNLVHLVARATIFH